MVARVFIGGVQVVVPGFCLRRGCLSEAFLRSGREPRLEPGFFMLGLAVVVADAIVQAGGFSLPELVVLWYQAVAAPGCRAGYATVWVQGREFGDARL